ncbi:MAG TPA: NYN domain-containing protein, partial [Thermoanaerobaculia bacterium]
PTAEGASDDDGERDGGGEAPAGGPDAGGDRPAAAKPGAKAGEAPRRARRSRGTRGGGKAAEGGAGARKGEGGASAGAAPAKKAAAGTAAGPRKPAARAGGSRPTAAAGRSRSRPAATDEPAATRRDRTPDDDPTPADLAEPLRGLEAPPERTRHVAEEERKIAMFCDLENIAIGVRDSAIKKFDINLVLERLLEKGKIIVKKAYCDWERYSDYKRPFHEAAIELIDIPQKYYSGKNSADIKMVVDAMDLCYSKEHLDTFAILSGDSDFSPLVSKLKENDKTVIGVGVKDATSALLVDNCDEFIYYEDIWRDRQQVPKVEAPDKKTSEAFRLMIDAMQALSRENKDVLWGSMIKQTMQRKKPSFNEGYYGYSTFSDLLEDAERNNLIKLKKDQRSGTYIVTGFSGRGGR